MSSTTQKTDGWHVTRTIPITILFALAIQLAGIVWTLSAMQSSINRNAHDIASINKQVDILRSSASNQAVQLGRIEEGVRSINKQLDALARRYDRKN